MAMINYLPFCIVAASLAFQSQPNEMRMLFVVSVPADTPHDAKVYVSGALPALGNWRADALQLTRGSDGRYAGSVKLPLNEPIDFKLTLGEWARVEKDARGNDISNRRFTIDPELPRIELNVAAWGNPSANVSERKRTITGTVKYHQDFKSKFLNNSRTLAVYLPPGYEDDKNARVPVLYMHDGQNLFDAATSFAGEWEADETADRLIRKGSIKPIIIVGIYNNAERMNEYSPDRDAKRGAGGRGAEYARFVVQEVKPFIDRIYRTRPGREDTAVAGSSMGGLISLFMCWKYPNVFSRCGIISPALMWNDAMMLKHLEPNHDWMKGIRFWLDMGTHEDKNDQFSDAMKYTRWLKKIFDSADLKKDRDYRYVEVRDGRHNEQAWAARFDQVLLFFYPNDNSSGGR